jgi:hypothetical protein
MRGNYYCYFVHWLLFVILVLALKPVYYGVISTFHWAVVGVVTNNNIYL